MNVKSVSLNNWQLCGNCGAKLFKKKENNIVKNIEIKCHQCKVINNV